MPRRPAGRNLALIMTGSLALQLAFIARSGFTFAQKTYLTLFDDAMVSMRYARNLAEGFGLVWNPGEYVEGYTNLLWTLWMALLHLIPVDESKIYLLVMLSGVAILLLNTYTVRLIASALTEHTLAVDLATALSAFYYPLIFWTLRGMEVGLVTLQVSLMVLLGLRLTETFSHRRLLALCALFSSSLLTRPDALVPCLAVMLFLLISETPERRKVLCGLALALAGTIGMHTLFRYHYYGDLLPNTYYLKMTGIPFMHRLDRGLTYFLQILVYKLALPISLAVPLLLKREGDGAAGANRLLLPVFVIMGQLCYSVYVGGDAWEIFMFSNRFITPAIPLLFILTAMGLERITSQARPKYIISVCLAAFGMASMYLLLPALGLVRLPDVLAFYLFRPFWRSWPLLASFGLLVFSYLVALSSTPAGWTSTAGIRVRMVARAALGPALFLLVFLPMNFHHYKSWARLNYEHFYDESSRIQVARWVRNYPVKDARIAVSWAGTVPYFTGNYSIDILGKCDRKIARMAPVTGFNPGHNKWDIDYSIGELEPDIIIEVHGKVSGQDRARIVTEYGYTPLAEDTYGLDAFYVRTEGRQGVPE